MEYFLETLQLTLLPLHILGIRRTHTLRDQRRQQLTQAPMTNHQSAAGHLQTHINTQW